MKELYEIFTSLKVSADTIGFSVQDIPNIANHKIGISKDKYPIFFIKSEYSGKHILDQSLEIISVLFNKECNLFSENVFKEKGYYTLIILKSNNPTIQKYFIDILYLLIKKMPAIPTLKDIREELNTIVELFRSFSKPPLKTIQGIWAEMLIIVCSNDPDYLVNAWHSSILSKFDFNDGTDKIEVKCTIKDRRVHRFSASQLAANPSSKIIIASVLTSETGIGLNIFDLRERIYFALISKDLISKIDIILSKTLGKDIEKAMDFFFDYNSAIDFIRFYDLTNIPSIIASAVPPQISSVKFDCDLTEVEPLKISDIKSRLIESLNIN